MRAVEAVAVSAPLVLLLFASVYAALSEHSASSFGGKLTHTDALTAKSESARLLVTAQMIINIVILGVAIKGVTVAAKWSRRHRQEPDDRSKGKHE